MTLTSKKTQLCNMQCQFSGFQGNSRGLFKFDFFGLLKLPAGAYLSPNPFEIKRKYYLNHSAARASQDWSPIDCCRLGIAPGAQSLKKSVWLLPLSGDKATLAVGDSSEVSCALNRRCYPRTETAQLMCKQ